MFIIAAYMANNGLGIR